AIVDPDDTKFDTDGDGVPDGTERQIGSDPRKADTDGDGLSDGAELASGSDPLRSDSDGDGLSDSAELNGMTFTYGAGKTTRIFTDPRNKDSDGDGFGDATEQSLGLNPHAFDQNPLEIDLTTDDADGILKPGAAFAYTATVRNQLKPGDYGRSGQILATGTT